MDFAQAVVESGTQRFRAIWLTSLTTFFGLVPMLAERSLQAKLIIPMATSLAFGIMFATVITLFLIPVLYLSLYRLRERWRHWRRQPAAPDVPAPPVPSPAPASGGIGYR